MAKASLKKVSSLMKGLDICMLTTVDARGKSYARPMSNNGEVEYDGTSYFFTWDDSPMVKEIKRNKNVSLTYMENKMLKKIFISVSGKARISKDRAEMSEHWSKDLDVWFKDGIKTKGLAMIEVEAGHIKYWKNYKEGELDLSKSK